MSGDGPEPRGALGIHLPSGKIFLRRVFTCGHCGETFKQHLTNSFRPCPRCRSMKKANHTPPSRRDR